MGKQLPRDKNNALFELIIVLLSFLISGAKSNAIERLLGISSIALVNFSSSFGETILFFFDITKHKQHKSVSCAVKAFVDATPISGPAAIGRT